MAFYSAQFPCNGEVQTGAGHGWHGLLADAVLTHDGAADQGPPRPGPAFHGGWAFAAAKERLCAPRWRRSAAQLQRLFGEHIGLELGLSSSLSVPSLSYGITARSLPILVSTSSDEPLDFSFS